MTINRRQKRWQVVGFLLSTLVAWRISYSAGESEFSGGLLTGRLQASCETAALLFFIAFLMSFWHPRIAAAIGVAAALLCLPFYLYFAAPGLFRQIAGGAYSIPSRTGFPWNPWAFLGILTIAVASLVGVRSFWAVGKRPAYPQ
jgi:hypothetical protein